MFVAWLEVGTQSLAVAARAVTDERSRRPRRSPDSSASSGRTSLTTTSGAASISRMDPRARQLLAVATEAQRRISEEFDRMTVSEIEGTKFDQAGLREGLKIVEDYLSAGEIGVAYDHLRYMIEETEIALSAESVRFLQETAAVLGVRPPRVPTAG